MEVRLLRGADIADHLDALARLRIAVFRDWPYLYDGDMAYERDYLGSMTDDPTALVVAVFDAGKMVGASTASALASHKDDFARAFERSDLDIAEVYYLAESVLLPAYRGRGLGHSFFDDREAEARRQGFNHTAFCAVERAADHTARPDDHRPLDPFWRARGYAPLPGVVARFTWRDLGEAADTEKPLQFWARRL